MDRALRLRKSGVTTVEDRRLLALSAGGDLRGLEWLARRYGELLFGYLVRIVRDRAAAEGLLHDLLVRAFERASECRDPAMFRAWLFAMARARARLIEHVRPSQRSTDPAAPTVRDF